MAEKTAGLDPLQQRIFELSQQFVVVGVTGTKGKTTVTTLIAHLLNTSGIPAAAATTIDTLIPGEQPWPPCKTQRMLLDLLDRLQELGIGHLVVEATSYSLAYGLADVCVFSGAVFTNLGHEHLNIHGSLENYLEAKRRLFISLGRIQPGWAVVNGDDPASPTLVQELASRVPVFRYGLPRRPGGIPGSLHFYAARRSFGPEGSSFVIGSPERLRVPVRTRLLGEFNVYNALAGVGAAYCLNLPPHRIQLGLASFVPPPGRFEVMGGGKGCPLVIVDYAHTPESLEQVLQAARQLLRGGRLWTVFGCGGETDPSKRPLMGRVAADLTDCIVLTSDNPRREDPAAIIAHILFGCHGGSARIRIQPDRSRAIAEAIRGAGPRDVIVVAGRGHETEQKLSDRTVPLSDRELVCELLSSEKKCPAGGGAVH